MYMFCYRAICGQLLNLAVEQIFCPIVDSSIAVVPTVCSASQKGSATSSQGIYEYIVVMATAKQSHYRPGQTHKFPGS
jgi:hypothetical protein